MVIALAGRRVDAPDAETIRFPRQNLATVRSRIEDFIRDNQAQALVCAAACGADILALEVAGESGLHRRIVLPYAREIFKSSSVIDRPGDWGERYDRILAEVEKTGDLVIFDHDQDGEETYFQTNRDILDQAALLAGEMGQDLSAVVVWNGQSRGEDDVTGHFVEEAQNRGLKVYHLLTV